MQILHGGNGELGSEKFQQVRDLNHGRIRKIRVSFATGAQTLKDGYRS
jgi:hypothetical protein